MKLKRTIVKGAKGADVHAVKRACARAGFGPSRLLEITDVYGTFAVTFMKRFQKKHGLKQDGVVGQATLDKLAPHFDSLAKAWYNSYRLDIVPLYVNPFKDCKELVLLRTDQGVDYAAKLGSPILAIGNSKISRVATNSGWPGGGVVQYVILDGDHSGEEIYVSEFIDPKVRVGQIVKAGTVIARFNRDHSSGVGIETGWIRRGTWSPCSTDISGTQTEGGKNFARWLRKLGCPTAQDPGPGSDKCPC